MKGLILLSIILVLTLQNSEVVLIRSLPSNTIITAPPHLKIGGNRALNTGFANFVGYDAEWVWQAGQDDWPGDYTLSFESVFTV